MSDHLDDSPASDHERAERIVRDILESSHSRHTISPSGELYRLIERYHSRRDSPQTNLPPYTMASEETLERRRNRLLAGSGDQSPFYVRPVQLLSQPMLPVPRERLASRLARRDRERSRSLYHPSRVNAGSDESNSAPSLLGLQIAGRQLEQASSTLRAHLDAPLPSMNDPSFDQLHDLEEQAQLRRTKRRKIESDSLDARFAGFQYGKYGQVDPGKLKMEIVSCDGGIYQEHGVMNYAAENILRNDDTVYCTKSNRCNLVLRHQGATVFSLKELIIKAPHSGYTAPVQEGMIFVSMTSDDLLTRTAQYQIQYSRSQNRDPNNERPNDRPSIMSIRHNHDGSAQARVGRLYDIGVQDEECDFRTAQIPPAFTSNAPPFQVTTECSDSEEERYAHITTAQRILRSSGNYPDLSDDDSHVNYILNDARARRAARLARRDAASNITLEEAAEASQIATQEAISAVGGEMMVPHARFFIERDKSKCKVTFDPPVSGRFILLKMWSPSPSPTENIDVQSVVAKGFAGPRFIPDITLR